MIEGAHAGVRRPSARGVRGTRTGGVDSLSESAFVGSGIGSAGDAACRRSAAMLCGALHAHGPGMRAST
eukprot:854465-Prymnesium_polylepis.1